MLREVVDVDSGVNSNEFPLINEKIESCTHEIGQKIFRDGRRKGAGLFHRGYWQSKMMQLAIASPKVKVQLFRFVDVLPVLKKEDLKRQHLLEYLSKPALAQKWPSILSLTSRLLHSPCHPWIVNLADKQVKQMGDVFIIGHMPEEVLPKILKLRSEKVGFTLDILGEAVLSEKEAQEYRAQYEHLIDYLGEASQSWKAQQPCDYAPHSEVPKVNVSIKVSAFDSQIDPLSFEFSLRRLQERIEPLLRKAMKWGIFINFDMEQFALKELTRELFKRILMKPEFRTYRHFGIVNQAYLKSASKDTDDWIEFEKTRGTAFSIRLVKGAYWDYEGIIADQNDWPWPVFSKKWEADACFEECAAKLLQAYPNIKLAAASHNVRSLSYVIAYAKELGLPKNAFEIQMLYGMSGAFKGALVDMGMRLREYCPMGEMLPGLSYLVRRLLENTANDSFLKQSFMDKKEVDSLLQNPLRNKSKKIDGVPV